MSHQGTQPFKIPTHQAVGVRTIKKRGSKGRKSRERINFATGRRFVDEVAESHHVQQAQLGRQNAEQASAAYCSDAKRAASEVLKLRRNIKWEAQEHEERMVARDGELVDAELYATALETKLGRTTNERDYAIRFGKRVVCEAVAHVRKQSVQPAAYGPETREAMQRRTAWNGRIISSANRMRIFDKSIDALGLPAGCQLLPLSAQPAPP
jgi:hypothetical protein